MQVSIEFMSLARDAAGVGMDRFDAGSFTVAELLDAAALRHGDALRALMLDELGRAHPWLMVTVNDVLVRETSTPLADGDRVTVAVPISGG